MSESCFKTHRQAPWLLYLEFNCVKGPPLSHSHLPPQWKVGIWIEPRAAPPPFFPARVTATLTGCFRV